MTTRFSRLALLSVLVALALVLATTVPRIAGASDSSSDEMSATGATSCSTSAPCAMNSHCDAPCANLGQLSGDDSSTSDAPYIGSYSEPVHSTLTGIPDKPPPRA